MIECCLLPPGSWMEKEMKSGRHEGKPALSEEERYTRLSFLVLFTFLHDPSVKQLTNPSWVDYTVARLCWMCNIYSIIRVGALEHVLYFCGGNHKGSCLVYHLIIMKQEWGFKTEQKSTSRKSGGKESAFCFHFKGFISESHNINKNQRMIPVVGERQRRGQIQAEQ